MPAKPKRTARKISITVDGEILDELKRMERDESKTISGILSEALKQHLTRLQMIALFQKWEAEDPSSPADVAAGEKLWREMQSCWTPERWPHLRTGTRRSGTRSKKI